MKKFKDMTFEEKKARIQKLNVIDDTLFHKVIEDRDVAEEIIRVLMNDSSLQLVETHAQKFLRNVGSKSVILDSLCIDGTGNRINVEVQKQNIDNHVKRVRYNISNLDTAQTEKGIEYKDLPDVYAFYISNFDMFKMGKVIYNIRRAVDDTAAEADNGIYEAYVNTAVDDGSDLANMMQYFKDSNGFNEKLPKLSAKVKYFKQENGGVDDMCEFSEWLRNEGREEGREEAQLEIAKSFKENGVAIEIIAKSTGLTPEKIMAL